jgi:hypothetical protein
VPRESVQKALVPRGSVQTVLVQMALVLRGSVQKESG